MTALKLTIFKRLIISYLVIILLVLCSGIYIVFHLHRLDGIIRSTNSIDVQAIRLSKEIAQAIYIQTGFEKKYLISGDNDFYRQFSKMNQYLEEKMAVLERLAVSPVLKTQTAMMKELHVRYHTLFSRLVQNKGLEQRSYRTEREKLIAGIEQICMNIAEFSDKARNEKLQTSEQISSRIVRAITVTQTASIVLVLLISFLITRSINAPIRLLREKTKTTARGEFGRPLEISSPPEIKELAESFNTMCDRLKELDQMKIDFISHLSHELRTPLTAIREASSMLKEGVYSRIPEKQQDLFEIINAECERLIRSVGRILDLSRMEAGMAAFQFAPCALAPIIEKTSANLSPIAQRKNIRLTLNLAPDVPPEFLKAQIDQDKIGQVIENLLGNALNFTPEGGDITIDLSLNTERKRIEIAVSDTGCGIPQESLEEIFDKFKRVDDGKGAIRGTGLGLSIAKHIINAHGGSIWAESEPGKGSLFIFSLPVLSAPA